MITIGLDLVEKETLMMCPMVTLIVKSILDGVRRSVISRNLDGIGEWVQILSEALGIKDIVPAYLKPDLQSDDLLTGVGFASGGSGIDPLTSSILLILIRNGNQSQQIFMFKILEQLLHLRLPLFWLKPLPRHSMTLVSLIWKKQLQNCRGSWRSYIFHNASLLFFQTISMSLSLKEPRH
nr:gdsl esterase/lipase exl3 [Quercus suber]